MNALINKLALDGKSRRNAIIVLGITGFAAGILLAVTLSEANFNTIADDISKYAIAESLAYTGTFDLFLEALIKYGHTPILIWILAFSSAGLIASAILLSIKFASAGFSAVVLGMCFGWRGIAFFILSCALQQCIMLIVYSFMFSVSIRFANVYHGSRKPLSVKHFKQYAVLCAACEAVAIFIAITEAAVLRSIIIFISLLP